MTIGTPTDDHCSGVGIGSDAYNNAALSLLLAQTFSPKVNYQFQGVELQYQLAAPGSSWIYMELRDATGTPLVPGSTVYSSGSVKFGHGGGQYWRFISGVPYDLTSGQGYCIYFQNLTGSDREVLPNPKIADVGVTRYLRGQLYYNYSVGGGSWVLWRDTVTNKTADLPWVTYGDSPPSQGHMVIGSGDQLHYLKIINLSGNSANINTSLHIARNGSILCAELRDPAAYNASPVRVYVSGTTPVVQTWVKEEI